ncbi:hypothetical protein ACSW8S_19745 (plasmid) [Clostridium perfringens]
MNYNEAIRKIHSDTIYFFNNIFNNHELQEEYDLIDYSNRDFVFHVIKDFRENPNACLLKPFYELDYQSSHVKRSILIRRDKNGFIISKIANLPDEWTIIEPFRFVSIIKEFIEDENIKKEMYTEATKDVDIDLSR